MNFLRIRTPANHSRLSKTISILDENIKIAFAIQKESLYLQHDSMSTVRDKRLTHVEKP